MLARDRTESVMRKLFIGIAIAIAGPAALLAAGAFPDRAGAADVTEPPPGYGPPPSYQQPPAYVPPGYGQPGYGAPGYGPPPSAYAPPPYQGPPGNYGPPGAYAPAPYAYGPPAYAVPYPCDARWGCGAWGCGWRRGCYPQAYARPYRGYPRPRYYRPY
jgi:hypothetical protein